MQQLSDATNQDTHFYRGKDLGSRESYHPELAQAIDERGSKWTDETFYHDLFAEAPIACFSVGVDGRIRAANRCALELVGYRAPELIGRAVFDLYADTPEGKTKAQEQFLLFRSGAEICGAELEMRHADGRSVWITLSAKPIRDRTGQVAVSCSVVQELQKNSSSTAARLEQHHAGPSFGSDSESFARGLDRGPKREFLERFVIKSGSTSHFVRMEDIDWVRGAGNYVELHIGKSAYLMRKTMNALQTKLDPRRFLRIHRSVIVNVERIKEIRPWHYGDHRIVLFDGTQLTLKRCHSAKLEQLVGEPV